MAMLGFAGVTSMDCSVAVVTVNVVVPEMLPDVALMTDVPAATLLVTPAAEIVATEVVAEAQVTVDVMLCEVPSE